MAITNLTDYKAYAGITGSTYDARLTVLIALAQKAAETFCDRAFDSATYTEKLDGKGYPRLPLRNGPIQSVTSVTVTDGDGSTLYTLAATDFKIDEKAIGLVLAPFVTGRFANAGSMDWGNSGNEYGDGLTWGVSPAFPDQPVNVTVVYVGGYASMPVDLIYGVWKMVDTAFARSGRDGGVSSESLGAYSVQWGAMNTVSPSLASFAAAWGMDAASIMGFYRRGDFR